MIQRFLFKFLMAPFALLYGIGISIYNGLYRLRFLRGIEFSLPVISVGNLTVGGSGKTPHIEYLVRLLEPYLSIAILSRGYRRKTKGYLPVHPNHDAYAVGDEPLGFKRKFPNVSVVVSESRAFAIPKMVAQQPHLQAILLDDAFQHRAVTPGLNILLTEYDRLFTRDYLMPVGRLREWRSGYKRADMIIVSKCPDELDNDERDRITKEINPSDHQKVYFSKYKYHEPYRFGRPDERIVLRDDMNAILVCALARTEYLIKHLSQKVHELEVMEFVDHHYYNTEDIDQLERKWSYMDPSNTIILTTEKDAMRLELLRKEIHEKGLPIYVLPIEVDFLGVDGYRFQDDLRAHLLDFEV